MVIEKALLFFGVLVIYLALKVLDLTLKRFDNPILASFLLAYVMASLFIGCVSIDRYLELKLKEGEEK